VGEIPGSDALVHGISLNVAPDLSHFAGIVPCGVAEPRFGVTSLRDLGRGRQVLCITHLPQIASLGDRHFSVVKDTSAEPTRAAVIQLAEGDVVSELVRMLGADVADSAARRHASDLRKAA